MHRKLNKGSLPQKEGRWKNSSDNMRSGDGEGIGNLLKYIGIAIIVIGVPLTLFLTRKKEKLSLYFGSALPLATIGTQERS